MMKSFAIAGAAIMLGAPAFAADQTADAAAGRSEISAHGAELAQAHAAKQARAMLVGQGYTGVSELEATEGGRYIGTAVKDGKTVIVGVHLPKPVPGAAK